MNLSRLNVIYWTSTTVNEDSDLQLAQLEQIFDSPIIKKADEYILAVERFEVSLNTIPYYNSDNNEQISIVANADPFTIQLIDLEEDWFSLHEVINGLNEVLDAQGINTFSQLNNAGFSLDENGYVTFSFDNFGTYTITFPDKLNQILGLEVDEWDATVKTWTSRYTRFDCGDDLSHVRLISNLDLVSDTIGQAKTNIVTDVAVNSSISGSTSTDNAETSNYSFSQRQKLNYTPSERRWLNFSSPIPIQHIRISAEYVRSDGTSSAIYLPRGGSFSIKIGFYFRG